MPLDLLTRDSAVALETRDAAMRPASFNAAERTIEVVVATDAAATCRDARGEYDEILDIAGADLSAMRGASVLDAHQRHNGLSAVIGAVEEAWREGNQIIARLRLSDRPEVASIVRDIGAGLIGNISAGYEVMQWADGERNGRRSRTATKWRPREVSFVPVSADPACRTRSQNGNTALPISGRAGVNRAIRDLCQRAGVDRTVTDDLIDNERTIEDARAVVLDALVQRGRVPIMTATAHNLHSLDDPANQTRAIGAAIYARMAGAAPSEQARPFMHRSVIDLMRDTLDANGVPLRDRSPAGVYQAAMLTRAAPGLHTSSDFPTLLGDVMGRRLGELFRAAESGASAIVAAGTARDFRPVTEARLTSFPSLEPLNEAGEIKWGSLDEEGEKLAIASYARAIGVTFKLMMNDDLGGIDRSIRDVAFATAQLKAKLIVAALAVDLADGDPLFHANHGNLAGTGAGMGDTTLDAGRVALARQHPPGSTEPLGLVPTILLVAPERQTVAEKLMATINPASVEDVNVFTGKLQIAVEPRLGTTTEWYLFCAPGTYPVIRFLTLQGFNSPRFETNEEFTRLGTAYRVHWHIGAGPIDFRGAWKNPGA